LFVNLQIQEPIGYVQKQLNRQTKITRAILKDIYKADNK